jgi:endonuclease/exonuclease/phosphatase family metal-dependent hydrolase
MILFVLQAGQVPASERSLKEKVPAPSIVSSANNDYASNKNKGNLTANTKIRFATYNVLFGLWAKPESVGKMFKPYNLDVICFNEVPHGNWTLRVGRELGMKHVHVGKVSSANHKDKYKSILSRFPLRDKSEVAFDSKGWKPASVVTARTNIKGVPLTLYSTHIPGQPDVENSAASFISKEMLSDPHDDNLFVMGDFNNLLFEGALKAFKEAGMKSIWHGLSINTDSISTHRHIESGNESGVIDHIFYRSTKNKVKVTNGGVIEKAYNSAEEEIEMDRYKKEWLKYGKPLSDHRPIWAEFTFMHD